MKSKQNNDELPDSQDLPIHQWSMFWKWLPFSAVAVAETASIGGFVLF